MTTDSFRIFCGSLFAITLPEIYTKNNTKETDSKGNKWGPFYIPIGESSGS